MAEFEMPPENMLERWLRTRLGNVPQPAPIGQGAVAQSPVAPPPTPQQSPAMPSFTMPAPPTGSRVDPWIPVLAGLAGALRTPMITGPGPIVGNALGGFVEGHMGMRKLVGSEYAPYQKAMLAGQAATAKEKAKAAAVAEDRQVRSQVYRDLSEKQADAAAAEKDPQRKSELEKLAALNLERANAVSTGYLSAPDYSLGRPMSEGEKARLPYEAIRAQAALAAAGKPDYTLDERTGQWVLKPGTGGSFPSSISAPMGTPPVTQGGAIAPPAPGAVAQPNIPAPVGAIGGGPPQLIDAGIGPKPTPTPKTLGEVYKGAHFARLGGDGAPSYIDPTEVRTTEKPADVVMVGNDKQRQSLESLVAARKAMQGIEDMITSGEIRLRNAGADEGAVNRFLSGAWQEFVLNKDPNAKAFLSTINGIDFSAIRANNPGDRITDKDFDRMAGIRFNPRQDVRSFFLALKKAERAYDESIARVFSPAKSATPAPSPVMTGPSTGVKFRVLQ